MKVKIGKYPNRLICGIYTRYLTNKYGYNNWPDKSEETIYERFLDKLEDAIQSFYNIINWIYFDRKEQTIKVRIDKQDTWSMDHTLAHIIVPMLKELKATKYGAPFVDDEDVPVTYRATEEWIKENAENGEIHPMHFAKWDWIMDEMIFAFEQKQIDNWEEQYYKYEEDKNETFGLKLVWEDMEGRKAHAERMENGFRLFGKYYQGLWS